MVVLYIFITAAIIEFVFRLWHHTKFKRPYHVSIKFPWNESHVVPHPFLSFSYKKNGIIDKNQKLPYPLHTNKYYSFKKPLNLNSIGHFGNEINLEKTKDTLRIFCLGASTTANNISDGVSDYSYPSFLQKYLEKKYPYKEVEVLNCGIGGWSSPDIVINFMLNLVRYKPDYIILYHGYNDLEAFLKEGFQADYSHSRKNLGEVLYKIRFAYMFPKIKFWHSYEFLKDKIFGTGNTRNDVLRLIRKGDINFSKVYDDLSIENDIIKNILIIAKHYDISCVLSSFAYYEYENTWQSKKLHQGVKIQNDLRLKLAHEFECAYVDQYREICKIKENFVDSIHFTPKGMKQLAKNFSEFINV